MQPSVGVSAQVIGPGLVLLPVDIARLPLICTRPMCLGHLPGLSLLGGLFVDLVALSANWFGQASQLIAKQSSRLRQEFVL